MIKLINNCYNMSHW